MPRLLLIGALPDTLHRRLAEKHDLVPLWEAEDVPRFLAQNAGQFDAGVTMAKYPLPPGSLEALRGKALVSYGVGTENLQAAHAAALGVQVSNTPDTATTAVAEMALGLMLAVSRRLVEGDRHVRSGDWERAPFGVATQISGKRVGIVGLGRIGRTVARMVQAFDMTVGYTGRQPQPEVTLPYFDSTTKLASWCDYLVLSCPGGPATHHLISTEVLHALGPRGYVINVARGSVVDEAALITALRQGTIGGAGLDVYESEPVVANALRECQNVVLTPHVAAVTHEGRQAMSDLVVQNLEHFLCTGRVVHAVRP